MNDSSNLTASAAAKYLGGLDAISEKTLAQWRSQGKGPPFLKIGARVLYAKSDLDKYIASCRRTRTARRSSGAEP
jgi:Helix-turn-helix domain